MNPRFVWLIGSIRDQFPDLPDPVCTKLGGVVLWDRQERKAVVTVAPEYAQAICLEHADSQPFTDLETWFNDLSNDDLASEGMVPTNGGFDPYKHTPAAAIVALHSSTALDATITWDGNENYRVQASEKYCYLDDGHRPILRRAELVTFLDGEALDPEMVRIAAQWLADNQREWFGGAQ